MRIGNATVIPGDLVVGDSEGVYFIRRIRCSPRVDAQEVR
jgi:regulator of RNase E activity RraA